MKIENYVVQPGDTLETLAKKFLLPIATIVDQNNLQSLIQLTPGTTLKIPINPSAAFDFYVVKKGDTLYSIAQRYNTTVEILTLLNGLDPNEYLYPDQRLLVPREGVEVYLTKMGDSLQTIADERDLKPEDILVYNERIYLLPDQLIAYKPKG